MWWHWKMNESLQSIWGAENKQTKWLQKIWHTSPEAGVDFTGRSYDIRSKKQNTNSFSVIGQLSPCARAIVLAVEWHFVPQWGVTVCHAGLCFSVCCHAVPEPWHWHTHHSHSSTPCRALTDLLILCRSVFLYPTPNPPSCRHTAELLKKSGATWSSLIVVLKMQTDFYRRDLSDNLYCGHKAHGGICEGLMHWLNLPYHRHWLVLCIWNVHTHILTRVSPRWFAKTNCFFWFSLIYQCSLLLANVSNILAAVLLKGKQKMSSATAETFLAFIELQVCGGVLCPNGENYTLGMMNQSFLGAQYLQHGCHGSFVLVRI